MSREELSRLRFGPACAFALLLWGVSAAQAAPTVTGISTSPPSPVPDGANVTVTIHGQGAPPENYACGVKVTIDGLPAQMIPVQGFPVTFDWTARIPKLPLQDEKPSSHTATISASGAAVGIWGACKGGVSAQVIVGNPWKHIQNLEGPALKLEKPGGKHLQNLKGPAPKFEKPDEKATSRDDSQRELDPEKPKQGR